MAQTSVHLKACDIAASEAHNKREKELDYVRKDLTHLNESFSYIDHSLQTELSNIRKEVKEKTGRKLQKNAVPIKEGVIVIDDKTTIADLQRYCEECRNKFGIVPLQIHIHRDEGHVRAKDWKPNLHAHIVWSMYDESGRNVRLSKQDCRDMQTLAAHVLGMERGKSSDKKHLSSLQFKINQLENHVQELKSEIETKNREIDELNENNSKLKSALEGVKQGVSDLFTGKARKGREEAERRAMEAEKREKRTIAESKKEVERIKVDADIRIREEKDKAAAALSDKKDFIEKYSDKIKNINNLEEKNQHLSSDNMIKTLKLENIEQAYESISNLIDIAQEQKLSADQIQNLRDGMEIEAPEHLFFQKKSIPVPKGSRLKYELRLKNFFVRLPHQPFIWHSLKTWLESAFKKQYSTSKSENKQSGGLKMG